MIIIISSNFSDSNMKNQYQDIVFFFFFFLNLESNMETNLYGCLKIF